MSAFVRRRALVGLPVLLLVTILAFLLVRLAPGDPADLLIPPEARSGASAQTLAALRHSYGLDQSLPVQYWGWLRHALTGDLGTSYLSQQPVTTLMGQRAGASAMLMGAAMLASLAIGVPLGVLAALRRNRFMDRAISVVSMTAISIPNFFLAMIAISVFALSLGWLPSAGRTTTGTGGGALDELRHLVLPAGVLACALIGPYMRFTRQAMLDALGEDYLRTARAMGIPARRRHLVHALRPALIPLVTAVFVQIPVLIGNTVVIERIFSWPGMGDLLLTSLDNQDYPVIVGFASVTGVVVFLANLLADLLAAALDPRIRHA
ncbi:MAG: peptide/nickel transport system permease protein [Solirubrobacteraceae bacterium]